ncbi:unnamed protein product [Mycena citricolor]|uniref:separase n=1 Tax=Mycena citricolor TaxID=2018698 RepID=A0AAD2Q5W9_9AGAR|nr:unnamed protein product [Mycena citricolor]
MSGKAFAAFCECWTNCANRTRNISALGQVANVVGKPSADTVDLSVQCTKSCTLFAQIAAAKETDLMDAVDWAGVTLVLSNPDLHGKMYRAMEKARRSVITSVDEGNDGAAFVEKVMDVLECSVQQNGTNDTLTSLLDTIFSVSRWALAGSPPKAHATLTRAVAALDLATERKANYARCVSGAFHNLAGTLYNATKYGAAIPFLEDGCKLGGNARELRRQEQIKDDKNADGWKQLDEQLWRRWELLGVCFSKLGNRRSAHASFVECIKAFPYDLYPVCPKWFECSPATVQLGTIVDRTTYLGACELFLDPGQVVLVTDQPLLLERQLASLAASRWKEGVQRVMQTLLRALLDVSKDRAGVLVACLEFGYYTGLSVVDGAADEVELLCADDPTRLHTRASAHLWAALDAHKQAESMPAHVELACRVLEGANAPKKTVASKPLRRTAKAQTPKAQSSKAQSSKVQTPKVETPAQLLELLHLVARVLSLQRHVLLKVRVLDITRRLAQDSDATREGHVIACMELGIEYGRLGKTRRATGLFTQAYGSLGGVPEELCVLVCLRYAEALVLANDVARSVQIYTEAMERAQMSESTEKPAATTVERVYVRVGRLERAAVAASVFGLIQRAREDILMYAEAMLRALRLWNRAVDTLARLSPTSTPDDDPFSASTPSTATKPRRITGITEFRVSEGLLATLFSLCEMYSARGSAREAEYFASQAHELAEGLAAITLSSRAVTRRGEIQMHMRQITEAEASLALATPDGIGRDAAELKGLAGDLSRLQDRDSDAGALYEQAYQILDEVDGQFRALEVDRSRQSAEFGQSVDGDLVADVLRKHIWLLRDNSTAYSALLQRFLALPASLRNNAQENVLLGRLTLHQVYDRFRTDMFLSESTIALPMSVPPPSHDILRTLESAEQLFWLDLTLFARTGDVTRVRDGSVSLAAVRALQTSLGHGNAVDGADAVLVAGLLDGASAIALGREMVEAIEHKVVAARRDDLEWVAAHEGAVTVAAVEDDDDEDASTQLLSEYWTSIKLKYASQAPDISTLSASRMAGVPANWTVVHMTVTDDRRTLFVSRQYGSGTQPPLVFCIPLQGRDGADQHLTYDDAVREFAEIVKLSDQGTRGAVHVDKDDPEARAKWWRERSRLDGRMKELVENIEFCWLGAFKTILSPRSNLLPPAIAELRVQFDRVFQRALRLQDSKVGPQKLDDDLLACFATLSPKCRDEELEDLVYFVLDLYQLHGMPVAVAEVDIDQVVVDLRSVLEEHHRRQRGAAAVPPTNDEHVFLVLDKNLQGLPWESTPILRGRSVSRIPNLDFLLDRIKLASWQKHGAGSAAVVDRAVVNPRKGVCVLNPSGDLHKTEARFSAWTESQRTRNGWETIVGRPPSEMEFLRALSTSDLVVYFGHGGGEQYARAHRIRNLTRCAAVMLWGCSSGLLRDLGDYERIGTPWNYMVAGCPSLVANLWDVTDRDIDLFSQAVFDKLALGGPQRSDPVSVVAAVAQSRDVCKLKYLTGAAPVVYGIPFYL